MSDVQSVRENTRLAYTGDTGDVNNGGLSQTGSTQDPRASYLVNYIQQVQQDILNGNTQGGTLDQKKAWLQQALDMLHTEFPDSSGWDPLAGQTPVGFQCNRAPTTTNHTDAQKYFEYREGKTTNVIIDRGDPNDPRPTEAHFYTPDNSIYLPDNATDVTYAYDKDAKTLTVTIKIPGGQDKTLVYHDVNRSNFKLKIESVNPDRVGKDANGASLIPSELSSKVSVKEYKGEGAGGAGSGERVGDQPTGVDANGNPKYDGKDFNISPAKEGSGQTISVLARGVVTLTANDNSEYYVFEHKGGKIIAHVFNDESEVPRHGDGTINFDKLNDSAKENIEFDEKLLKSKNLKLDIDPSRIEWTGDLKGSDSHTLNANSAAGKKIQIISDSPGTAAGQPLVEGDSPVISFVDELNDPKDPSKGTHKVAVYDRDADVSVHANFDDDVHVHNITASGKTTISPANASDTVTRSYDFDNNRWIITITPAGGGEPEIFRVDASRGQPPPVINTAGVKNADPIDLSKVAGHANQDSDKRKGQVQTLARLVAKASSSGKKEDWDAVKNYLNGTGGDGDLSDPDHANDVARGIIDAMWEASGTSDADHSHLIAMLKLIPPEIRQQWMEKARHDGSEDRYHNGTHRNGDAAAALIQESLN